MTTTGLHRYVVHDQLLKLSHVGSLTNQFIGGRIHSALEFEAIDQGALDNLFRQIIMCKRHYGLPAARNGETSWVPVQRFPSLHVHNPGVIRGVESGLTTLSPPSLWNGSC